MRPRPSSTLGVVVESKTRRETSESGVYFILECVMLMSKVSSNTLQHSAQPWGRGDGRGYDVYLINFAKVFVFGGDLRDLGVLPFSPGFPVAFVGKCLGKYLRHLENFKAFDCFFRRVFGVPFTGDIGRDGGADAFVFLMFVRLGKGESPAEIFFK